MVSLIFQILFSLISIYFLLKVIGFAIYEMKELHNKSGGIAVISFSAIVAIFANVVVWIN